MARGRSCCRSTSPTRRRSTRAVARGRARVGRRSTSRSRTRRRWRSAPFERGARSADFDRTVEVTFLGAVNVVRAALPALERSGGVLVVTGSINALAPLPSFAAYAASQARAALVPALAADRAARAALAACASRSSTRARSTRRCGAASRARPAGCRARRREGYRADGDRRRARRDGAPAARGDDVGGEAKFWLTSGALRPLGDARPRARAPLVPQRAASPALGEPAVGADRRRRAPTGLLIGRPSLLGADPACGCRGRRGDERSRARASSSRCRTTRAATGPGDRARPRDGRDAVAARRAVAGASSPTTGAATAGRARPSRTCARRSTSRPRTSPASCARARRGAGDARRRGLRRARRARRAAAPPDARARARCSSTRPRTCSSPRRPRRCPRTRAALEEELRARRRRRRSSAARGADRRLRRDRVAAAQPRRRSRRSTCRSRSSSSRGAPGTHDLAAAEALLDAMPARDRRGGRRRDALRAGRTLSHGARRTAPSCSPGRPVGSGTTSPTRSPRRGARLVVSDDRDAASSPRAPLPGGVDAARGRPARPRRGRAARRARRGGRRPVDVLVNCAGLEYTGAFHEQTARRARGLVARQPARADGAHPRGAARDARARLRPRRQPRVDLRQGPVAVPGDLRDDEGRAHRARRARCASSTAGAASGFSAVSPGFVAARACTRGWQRHGVRAPRRSARRRPSAVAQAVLRAIERRRAREASSRRGRCGRSSR